MNVYGGTGGDQQRAFNFITFDFIGDTKRNEANANIIHLSRMNGKSGNVGTLTERCTCTYALLDITAFGAIITWHSGSEWIGTSDSCIGSAQTYGNNPDTKIMHKRLLSHKYPINLPVATTQRSCTRVRILLPLGNLSSSVSIAAFFTFLVFILLLLRNLRTSLSYWLEIG